MAYESKIVRAEVISSSAYKLITEAGASYSYKCIDIHSDTFESQETRWKEHVVEGQKLLLDWIENQTMESPGQIYWNYKGKAMLEIELKSKFHLDTSWHAFSSEINPFEFKDVKKWVVDPACPFLKEKGCKPSEATLDVDEDDTQASLEDNSL